MVKPKYFYLTAFLFSMMCGLSIAQSRSSLEDQGYEHLNNHDFESAYYVFDKLHKKYPKEPDYHFKLGIAALNFGEKKERAIEIFQEIRNKNKTVEAEFYLGKAYHRNYRFDEAIITLQPLAEALKISRKKEDKEMLPQVQLVIKNCLNGKFLIDNKIVAEITNIGGPINTNELEGVPVITADESMMIYTYIGKKSKGGRQNTQLQRDPNGQFLSDIYVSYRDTANGGWLEPEPIDALNTRGNDAAIALSPDGLTLFTFLSNNENEGDILVSQLSGTEFSKPVPLNENINTPDHWEGSCSISADGKYLYFSSERPGGLGGRDIYVSEKIDGDWGPALNLGPRINTELDDDAPFIHPDGLTLFFSSKGHTSIGGYDIMFSIKEGNDWTEPKSMGIPLNTTEDDSYYVINSAGDKGFFSSTRTGAGGLGSHDIYMVTPGILGEKPVLALLKGIVYGNEKPVEARIDVIKKAEQEKIGPYFSNSLTGKYLTALSPGFVYRIIISADGYDAVEEDLDIAHLDKYIEQTRDFYLYSSEFVPTAQAIARKEAQVKKIEAPVAKPPAEEPVAVVTEKEKPVKKEEEKKREEEQQEVAVQEQVKETPSKQEEKEEKQKVAVQEEAAEKKPERQEIPKEKEKESPVEEIAVKEKRPCDSGIRDFSELKGKSLNDIVNYNKLLKMAGTYCAENLVFKVQIGAYKHPENFKYGKYENLGRVSATPHPDGLTRFTQNEYNTLIAAEKQRQKLIGRGIKDAWIVAYAGGKRYTLEDFIMVDFLSGPVN